MPESVKTVALVDPLWVGHHPMYFGQFAASFLRAGARIIGLCPEPDAALREIGEASEGIEDWQSRVHLRHMPAGARSFLWGRFEGDPLRTFQRWLRAGDGIDAAEQETGWHTDLVYFPYLDSYLRFLPVPGIPDIALGRPWSGLYLRNHHHQPNGSSLHASVRMLAKGDAIFRSPLCRGIGVLDERFNDAIERFTGKEVTPYPDVTQTLLPETEPELVRSIRTKAAGRSVIGLIGLEKRKGTLTMMRLALAAHELRLPWYFVFAGVFRKSEYFGSDRSLVESFARKVRSEDLDNVHFDPDAPRIPTEPDFNALFASFDIAWAAYEGFQGSSGTLSKAAAFEIPSVASDGECIGHRIRKFRTGLTIEECNAEQAREAIGRLLAGKDWEDAPLLPDYAGFREAHSIERLDSILATLVATA